MSEREALEYAITHADGWVVENLRTEYNSVFPSSLITCRDDMRIGEKLLTAIMGVPVRIKKTEGGYICEL